MLVVDHRLQGRMLRGLWEAGGNAQRQMVQGREQPLMSHALMLDTKLLRRKKHQCQNEERTMQAGCFSMH